MASKKKRTTKKTASRRPRATKRSPRRATRSRRTPSDTAKRTGASRGATKRQITSTAKPRAAQSAEANSARPRGSRGRSAPGLPYLHYVGARHGVKIWIVDGAFVRKNIDEEFSNFGHHFSISKIPRDEIWLDREAHPDEQRFFIAHAVIERRAMVDGKGYDTARQLACDAEYRLRAHTHDLRQVRTPQSLPQADKVHVRLRKELLDGTGVWIVDGRLVRSVFDIEFTEGGHEYVYEFVPHGQVWVDDDVTEQEIGYVILHEIHERNLMAKGMTYDDAHASASKIELQCRRHPHLLHAALAAEGWE